MPGEIPHANGEANWQRLASPILKDLVRFFGSDVAGHRF
jgi:hypothetical protein